MNKCKQIIKFKSGNKKTFDNIIEVKEGDKLHLIDTKGRDFIIDQNNIEWTEVIPYETLEAVVDETTYSPGYINDIKIYRKTGLFTKKLLYKIDWVNGKSQAEVAEKINEALNNILS